MVHQKPADDIIDDPSTVAELKTDVPNSGGSDRQTFRLGPVMFSEHLAITGDI